MLIGEAVDSCWRAGVVSRAHKFTFERLESLMTVISLFTVMAETVSQWNGDPKS